MVKKRRTTSGRSFDSKNRAAERSPQSGDEVTSARDRFKGALLDLMPHSEEETESSDEDPWVSKSKRASLQKKKATANSEKTSETDSNRFQQAFVMKLFDRSVDLAQFNESTPLYPICRAWIANQPHQEYNQKDALDSKEAGEENNYITEKDIEAGKDAYSLAPPEPVSKFSQTRIPPLTPYQTKYNKFYEEGTEPPTKEEILNDNLSHWRNVRKNWLEAAAQNEQRYAKSFQVLTAIYNKAQATYE